MKIDQKILKTFILQDEALLAICYDFVKLKSYLESIGVTYPVKIFSSPYLYIPEILQAIHTNRNTKIKSFFYQFIYSYRYY